MYGVLAKMSNAQLATTKSKKSPAYVGFFLVGTKKKRIWDSLLIIM